MKQSTFRQRFISAVANPELRLHHIWDWRKSVCTWSKTVLLEWIDRPADRCLRNTTQYMVRNDVQSLCCYDNISSEMYHGATGEAGAGGHAERTVRGAPQHHWRFFLEWATRLRRITLRTRSVRCAWCINHPLLRTFPHHFTFLKQCFFFNIFGGGGWRQPTDGPMEANKSSGPHESLHLSRNICSIHSCTVSLCIYVIAKRQQSKQLKISESAKRPNRFVRCALCSFSLSLQHR